MSHGVLEMSGNKSFEKAAQNTQSERKLMKKKCGKVDEYIKRKFLTAKKLNQ